MEPIKVLVVDDSVVIRRLLTAVLDGAPGIEVVGYSSNGRLALEKIQLLDPDVVSLDVMMPEMDGIACVREIRKRFGDLPVIMFSSLTEEGAAVTMEALDAGANDFVTKPWKTDGFADSVGQVGEQLIGRIRALHEARTGGVAPRAPLPKSGPTSAPAARPAEPTATPVASTVSPAPRPVTGPIEAVVIGSSTGGPNALNEVFGALPGDLGVPILLAQHMPPMFTRLLGDRLTKRSAYQAVEAQDGAAVEPDRIVIAPGDYHMRVVRDGTVVRTVLDQQPPIHSCRPAVDPLFASARDVWGGNLLAVVLTGMGHDGAEGAALIHAAGGQVLAQDEATSVVWGMPGAVVAAGAADVVLPLERVADEIVARVHVGKGRLAGGGAR